MFYQNWPSSPANTFYYSKQNLQCWTLLNTTDHCKLFSCLCRCSTLKIELVTFRSGFTRQTSIPCIWKAAVVVVTAEGGRNHVMPVRSYNALITSQLSGVWPPCSDNYTITSPHSPHSSHQHSFSRVAGRERWELSWYLTGSVRNNCRHCSVWLSHTVSLSVNSRLTTSLYSRYQNELPKKIKSRGKESHLTHEELVQLIKWKLAVSFSYNSITDRLSDWLTDYQELQSQQDFYLFILISNRHLERSLPPQIKGLDTNEHPQGCHARNQKGVQGYW